MFRLLQERMAMMLFFRGLTGILRAISPLTAPLRPTLLTLSCCRNRPKTWQPSGNVAFVQVNEMVGPAPFDSTSFQSLYKNNSQGDLLCEEALIVSGLRRVSC